MYVKHSACCGLWLMGCRSYTCIIEIKKEWGGCCRFMFTTNHSGHSVRCCFSSGKSHEKTHNSLRSEMNAGTFGKKQEETSSCEDRRISSPLLSCTTGCNNQPFDPVNCQLNHVVWLLSTCLYQQGLIHFLTGPLPQRQKHI